MKIFHVFIIILFTLSFSEASEDRKINDKWKTIIIEGSNKNVNFHAWGGSKNINNYIKWVSEKVKNKYGIKLKHIKIKDTSQAVKKVLYEKISKKNTNGSIDIIGLMERTSLQCLKIIYFITKIGFMNYQTQKILI